MSARLRFAPSPTGLLHVGNARTAIINYLLAKKLGGEFILRLDDTDRERTEDHFIDAIIEDLSWLGIAWDLTFRQSARLDHYDKAVEVLKAQGRLYPCYETPQELEVKRKVQLSRGLPPVYDRAALSLSKEEIETLEAEGRRPHWRFRLDHETVSWHDGIRGEVHYDLSALSDPILIRGDGTYLYTLPSVVDDLDYGITHVVRGEDHVTNTAAQIQLFRALGGSVPEFAHNALLTGAEGEKLSKRLGTLSIRELRLSGIEPMTITGFLARIGTADPIEPFTEMGPLINQFDLGRFGRAAAKFDPHDLDILNAKVVHQLPYSVVKSRLDGVDEALWATIQPNLQKVADAEEWVRIINGPLDPAVVDPDFLEQAAAMLPSGPWDQEVWARWTSAIKEATGRKGKELFMPLRMALTGLDHGPEMKLLLPLIGPDRARARLLGKAA